MVMTSAQALYWSQINNKANTQSQFEKHLSNSIVNLKVADLLMPADETFLGLYKYTMMTVASKSILKQVITNIQILQTLCWMSPQSSALSVIL
jgi:hypothetical protein